ncbi:MAG: tRNA methyltransferase, partial [Clostridia bacterium]|nr:tRNA methyltransferase [Clostridia bacterium]
SYTIGASPTIELLKSKPEAVSEVYIHSKYKDCSLIEKLCGNHIYVIHDDKIFDRLGVNDNSFVLGVFQKYEIPLSTDRPHIVLVNPGDMGNLGTIIRSIIGLGYKDLAIITPAADIYNPKTVRASMGALFKLNFRHFVSFDDYKTVFSEHKYFPFMLGAEYLLNYENCPEADLFSLIFGNEAGGLEKSFLKVGQAIQIPQTAEVDSLNLAVAAAIGVYTFALKNKLIL